MQAFLSEYQAEKSLISYSYLDLTKLDNKKLLKLFVKVSVTECCKSWAATGNKDNHVKRKNIRLEFTT